MSRATEASPEHPVLVDRFLDDAVEVDVDALFDGKELYLAGVMEHIEEAGIHSGDSACALPPITLGKADLIRIRQATEAIARGVGVRGLVNVQYAVQADVLYVLEANPRASRTVPFVAKATGVQVAKAAARVMLGASIAELRAEGLLPAEGDGADMPFDSHIAVKEAVLPFNRFTGVDTVLGPEMKSTGEVMGIDAGFGVAYAKSQSAAYGPLPTKGRVFVSLANRDKRAMIFPVKRLVDLGFEVLATEGTAQVLRRNGVPPRSCPSTPRGSPGDAVARILAGEIDLVINTPFGNGPRVDGYEIRSACVTSNTPVCHDGARRCSRGAGNRVVACAATSNVRPLQEWHAELGSASRRTEGAAPRRLNPSPPSPVSRRRRVPSSCARRRCYASCATGPTPGSRFMPRRSPSTARPGQFVAFAVGGPASGLLLRRAFSIARIGPAGTVEVVVAPVGPGTRWLTARVAGDRVDIVGPLGRPFPLPVPAERGRRSAGAARRWWLRGGAAVRSGGGAARAGLRHHHGTRRRDGRQALRRARRPGGSPTSAAFATEDGSVGVTGRVTAAFDPPARRTSTWSTRAGRWRCSLRSPGSPSRPGSPPTSPSKKRWPAASACA